MRLPPGPRGLPLLGSTLEAFREPYGFFMRAWQRYGDVVLFTFGPYRYFLVNDPEGIKHVLVDRAKNYPKSITYRAFEPLLGKGLLTSEGDLWRRQRRLVQPAFHRECLESFAQTMAIETERRLERWRGLSDPAIDIHREMGELTFRIVGRTLFDTDVDGDGSEVAGALKVGLHFINDRATTLIQIPPWVPTPGHLAFMRARRTLVAVVRRIVEDRKHEKGPRKDVVSLLGTALDEDTGEAMSARQLEDEVMTLALAGYETTSNALTWTFYLLSKHPAVARKLEREVDEVLGDRRPTFADLPRLEYAQRVVQEAMRLYPPAWKIERQAIEDDSMLGYDVPAGTIVGITMHTLHRHPDHWENPEGFEPERFAPEASRARARHAYLPFGGGSRQCIGSAFALMEAQIILSMIAREYRIDLAPGAEVEIEPAVTLHPRHGMPMRLSRRSRGGDASRVETR
jgi:cytochrome P450